MSWQVFCSEYNAQVAMCAGAALLDLPTEILQAIADHFDAAEWATGPAIACQRLYKMPLTRLSVDMVGLAPLSAALIAS